MGHPNIAVVVMDTARATETVPADPTITPTLAELADEGTAYSNAFTSAPWTLPSHASLFTGTYASRHGAHGGHTYLDEGYTTLAETLAGAGYETVGISNNTWITEEFGFARGFETFHKTWQLVQSATDLGEVTRAEHARGKLDAFVSEAFSGNPIVNGLNAIYDEFVRTNADDGAAHTTDWLADWLGKRDGDRPFFCFANYIEPHIEYRPPREYAEPFLPEGTYEEAIAIRQDPRAYDVGEYAITEEEFALLEGLYRGELAYLDAKLGEFRAALEAAGEWEDTVLVVCGDHGENIGDHGFLGHQYNVYDTLLHVPLVIHGGPEPAADEDELIQLLDLFPTLLDLAGVDAPAAREQAQGRSLLTRETPRESVIAEYVSPQPSMAQLEERFGSIPDSLYEYDRSLRAIRTDEYKYIRGSDGSEELYDVEQDPEERFEIAATEPEIAAELAAELEGWADSFEHADVDEAVEMAEATKGRLRDLGYL
ncbi:sulfatase [Halalkalicoccus jeotgali]|uniref:Sulfatase n=1 Tax=Halalkalicoccus jeotgali (strain DSM 18796 / CECT 7217 / JCM 14584 / KCTC 4019 / B3) TaxID=795797 RepID=D8J5N0_HALJB|nr:sulfatase [Halalkalicoccus jeotgali]ADJ15726.1 sulfatase [Halalkalicoccus jeotgali B3]ELY36504.1 sulfatase [Halalkalicoccus jeotgali B3]